MKQLLQVWSVPFIVGILVAIGCFATFTHRAAATAPASKGAPWTPSEMQKLRLENKQLKAGLAQRDFQVVQRNWNEAVGALNAECAAVVKENQWPADMTCDISTLKFVEPVNPNSGLDHKPGPAATPKKP